MAISTSLPISFSDVMTEMGLSYPKTIIDLFLDYSRVNGFNPTYSGSKDRLTNFRGYIHNKITCSPSSKSTDSLLETFTITITCDSAVAWSISKESWITTTKSSGFGSTTFNATISKNNSGSPRSGLITVYSTGTGASAFYSISISQSA